MLIEQTLEQVKAMGLRGMGALLEAQLHDPSTQSLSSDERIGLLVDAEYHDREQRRRERLLKAAKLKDPGACLEAVDYVAPRGLDRGIVSSLSNCAWIQRCQHLIVTGPTGSGKTWLGCAMANQALRTGLSVAFFRFPRILEEMEIARADGSLPKLRAKIAKVRLLVLDDWAVAPITVRGRQDLLELVEDRGGFGSLLITSQLPVSQWHEYLGDPSLADAILDRIVHQAHKIELHGESMRRHAAATLEDPS